MLIFKKKFKIKLYLKSILFFIGVFCISQAGSWTSVSAFNNLPSLPPTGGQTPLGDRSSDFYSGIFYPATTTETVSEINLLVSKASSQDGRSYYLDVYSGTIVDGNIGNLIATSNLITDNNLGNYLIEPYLTTFVFLTPFEFVSGTNYAIMIRSSGGNNTFQNDNITTESYPNWTTTNSLHRFYHSNNDYILDNDRGLYFSTSATTSPSFVSLISPATNSTTSTETVTFSGSFYADSTVWTSLGEFNGIVITLNQINLPLGEIAGEHEIYFENYLMDEVVSYSLDFDLPVGTQWTAQAYQQRGVTKMGITSSPVSFSVVSGTLVEPLECGVLHIDNCLINAFNYMFAPSESSLADFSSLTLENKAPFSYIYDLGNVWDELFDTPSTESMSISVTTPLGPISFISAEQIQAVPYTSLIKTIISALCYLFTALTIYKLVLRIHN